MQTTPGASRFTVISVKEQTKDEKLSPTLFDESFVQVGASRSYKT